MKHTWISFEIRGDKTSLRIDSIIRLTERTTYAGDGTAYSYYFLNTVDGSYEIPADVYFGLRQQLVK